MIPRLAVLWLFLVSSCSDEKMEITTEYIINSNWTDQANAIKITKMKLKKDSAILNINTLYQQELLSKLEEDSSFMFVGNVPPNGVKYSERKVFFNKDNGFWWWTADGNHKQKVIGNLKMGSWYEFSDLLTYPYSFYVYIDSANDAHRFNVNLANY